MKVVILSLEDARKTELAGADNLAKTDSILILSTKNKTDYPSVVKDAIGECKCECENIKLDSTSEYTAAYAYYGGFHQGKGHQTFIVAPDKTKLPASISKQIKTYTSFASVIKAEGGSTKSTSSKSSGSKSSSKSKSSSTRKTTESTTVTNALSETISNITGMKKSDSKKLVKGVANMFSKKDEE